MTGVEPLLAGAELLARSGRPLEIQLQGKSMTVSIPDGVLVRIEPLGDTPVSIGEVVAFRDGVRLVAHRVGYRGRGKRSREYTVPIGDSYIVPDQPVHRAAILGRVRQYREGASWRSVPSAVRRRPLKRAVAWLTVAAVSAALEIDPRLAGRLASIFVSIRSKLHSGRTSNV
jgi:hypothetical protein